LWASFQKPFVLTGFQSLSKVLSRAESVPQESNPLRYLPKTPAAGGDKKAANLPRPSDLIVVGYLFICWEYKKCGSKLKANLSKADGPTLVNSWLWITQIPGLDKRKEI